MQLYIIMIIMMMVMMMMMYNEYNEDDLTQNLKDKSDCRKEAAKVIEMSGLNY